MGKKPAILRLLRSTALPHVRTRDRRGLPPRCQMGLATKSQVLRMAQNRSNILVNSNKRHILHTHTYIYTNMHISYITSPILHIVVLFAIREIHGPWSAGTIAPSGRYRLWMHRPGQATCRGCEKHWGCMENLEKWWVFFGYEHLEFSMICYGWCGI